MFLQTQRKGPKFDWAKDEFTLEQLGYPLSEDEFDGSLHPLIREYIRKVQGKDQILIDLQLKLGAIPGDSSA